MFKRIYMFNGAGATEEEALRGVECLHLGNAKEATLFYHPQYVYNGCDVNDGNIDGDEIDGAPQTNFYNEYKYSQQTKCYRAFIFWIPLFCMLP